MSCVLTKDVSRQVEFARGAKGINKQKENLPKSSIQVTHSRNRTNHCPISTLT